MRSKLFGEDGEAVDVNTTAYDESSIKFPWSERVESRTLILELIFVVTVLRGSVYMKCSNGEDITRDTPFGGRLGEPQVHKQRSTR